MSGESVPEGQRGAGDRREQATSGDDEAAGDSRTGTPTGDDSTDDSVRTGGESIEKRDVRSSVGHGFDLGSATARELAQTAARMGANAAIAQSVDLSKIMADVYSEAFRNLSLQSYASNVTGALIQSNIAQMDEITRTFANSALFTTQTLRDALSVASLYSARQLFNAAAPPRVAAEPRASRLPEDFFDMHAVEIEGVNSLLKALYKLQMKQHEHRLVWRGQQVASWSVHSSLYRQLELSGPVDEDRLVAAEVEELNAASLWGRDVSRPLKFFADLQHHGAPTRLIDVSTDPEIACWFAVEADPEHDDDDGSVLAWGRAPRVGRTVPEPVADVSAAVGDVPFWHAWGDSEHRRPADWGTGTRTWTWFPPALSDRMRAQRGGFLLEAGPILTQAVVRVFNDELPMNWRSSEIARATSIIGLPSRHDVLTKPNAAHLVPVFVLRIRAKAKRPIREYLEGKGLRYSTVYPDLGGLVQHLRGPHGPS